MSLTPWALLCTQPDVVFNENNRKLHQCSLVYVSYAIDRAQPKKKNGIHAPAQINTEWGNFFYTIKAVCCIRYWYSSSRPKSFPGNRTIEQVALSTKPQVAKQSIHYHTVVISRHFKKGVWFQNHTWFDLVCPPPSFCRRPLPGERVRLSSFVFRFYLLLRCDPIIPCGSTSISHRQRTENVENCPAL